MSPRLILLILRRSWTVFAAIVISQFCDLHVGGSLGQRLPQGLEAGMAVVVVHCLLRMGICVDRTVSPLSNFPTSGSSTVQNPVQRSVGRQRGVLSGQFYPNKLDIGIHLRSACGLPDALGFLPVSSCLFLLPLVLPPLPQHPSPSLLLWYSQIACSKEMFQLPFPEYPLPQFLLLILFLPSLSSSPFTKVLFVNSHFLRRSLAAGVWIDFL